MTFGCKGTKKTEMAQGLASPLVPFKFLYRVLKPDSHLSVTGVKLDMLLGNANINYDPDRESEVGIQTGTLVPDRVHVAGKRKCQL